jgi:basic membrane protein A
MKNKLSFIALVLLIFFLGTCIPVHSLESNKGPLKIGFVLTGSASDKGWNEAHDQGRIYLQNKLGNRVKTSVVEQVPESAEVERVLEKMIAQGDKLIFTTSYGFLEPALRVAARHPDVIFMQCQRSSNAKNLGTYFVAQHEPFYVAGIVAGKMTKTNKLGYIAGHPVPTVLASINAYALGAHAVNSKARVKVVWNNSWGDPANEAEATKGLIESGVDVMTSQLNTGTTVVQNAERAHAYSVGTQCDIHTLAPKGWLVGTVFNWGPLYVKITKSVLDGTWKAENNLYPMKDGYTDITGFGHIVPPAVQAQALAAKKKIEQGTLNIFQGPLKDQNGKVRIPSGKAPDFRTFADMDWLVPNVDATLPKK